MNIDTSPKTLELIKERKVRLALLTEGQFIGKYICSNCKADWVDKIKTNNDDEEYNSRCCNQCGIPDMDEYKVFVNAEKDGEL